MIFTDSQGFQVPIVLNGAVPGTTFSGSITVTGGIADGAGAFTLGPDALDDGQGNKSNEITGVSGVTIDQTAPLSPQGLSVM